MSVVKNIITSLLAMIVLQGCKKDRDKDPYYVQFEIGDSFVRYDAAHYLSEFDVYKFPERSLYTGSVLAAKRKQGMDILMMRDAISLIFYDSLPIKVGERYQLEEPVENVTGKNGRAMIIYYDANGEGYHATVLNDPGDATPSPNKAVIELTEYTDDYSKGIFSGILVKSNNPSEIIEVKNGSFYLKTRLGYVEN